MARNLTDEKPEFDAEQLKKDLLDVMANREKVASANQAHGNKLKTLEETRGYHKQAFNTLMSLSKKSPDYLKDWKRTFDAGFAVVEEMVSAGEEQPDMLDQVDKGVDFPAASNGKKGRGKRAAKERQPEGVH